MRALPCGTVGGRTALARMPAFFNCWANAKVASLLPNSIYWMAELFCEILPW